jgi:outer membrane lipoprotein-sorting protein
MSTESTPGEESFADIIVGLRASVPELSPPPSLLPDLRRRYARRIALRRAGHTAIPAALAVAVGIGLTAIPRGSSLSQARPTVPSSPAVHDAAYVTAQVSKALAGANQDILVESSTIRTTASGAPIPNNQHGTRKTWVSMRTGQIRTTEDIDGAPDFESGLSAPGAFTVIDYPKHRYLTWPAGQQHPELPHGTFTAAEIQQAMASGKLSITAQNQQVDGQSTVELTGNLVPKDEQGTKNATPQPQRFWVNSTTYLPVRSETQDQTGTWTNGVDYVWLPPAPENDALLTVTIPAGLTKAN